MTKENAINFLLYSYFELTLDSNENEILEAAIKRAYRDASSRVLSVSEEEKNNEERQNSTPKTESIKYLAGRVLDGLKSNEKYDDWFDETCKNLMEKYAGLKNKKDEDAFTFGHAQKWVNMIMKYLYVMKSIFNQYGKDNNEIFSLLTEDKEMQLHVPVDSYIMEATADKQQDYGLGVKLPSSKTKSEETSSYSSADAWSKWSRENYEFFRSQISEKISGSPLDWEGPAWIAIAKKRKEKEQKK